MAHVLKKHEGVSDEEIQFGKRILSGAIGILQICIIIEFLCYIIIFKGLQKQDKSFIKIIQEDVLKKRLKKNTITLTGQAFGFIVELMYSILAQLLLHFGPQIGVYVSGLLPCALIVTMAAYTSAQIISSPELRRFLQGYD